MNNYLPLGLPFNRSLIGGSTSSVRISAKSGQRSGVMQG
jgi:hypothetical protein